MRLRLIGLSNFCTVKLHALSIDGVEKAGSESRHLDLSGPNLYTLLC